MEKLCIIYIYIYIQITLHTNQRAMPYIFNQRLCGKEIIHRQDICIYIYIITD